MTGTGQTIPRCTYSNQWAGDAYGWAMVCRIHGQNSKHDVDEDSHLPCLELDPWPVSDEEDEPVNIFDIHHSEDAVGETYGRNSIEVGVTRGRPRDVELRLIEED